MPKKIDTNNSLLEVYPDIAKEWDYQKNEGLLPSEVAPKSHKKVWWICLKCGYEWMAAISNRTGRNTGCPKCRKKEGAKKRIKDNLTQGDDFESWCKREGIRGQRLLEEWDYKQNGDIKPSEVSYGSTIKVFWRCSKGHSWKADLNNRTRGKNCPVCANKIIIPGVNDLCTQYPQIASEWNYKKNKGIDPKRISYGSEKLVWWICEKGHEWQASPNNRTSNNRGCPVCAHAKVDSQETSLAACFPELMKEWDKNKNTISPDQVFPTSKIYVWWKCQICKCSWRSMVGTRTKGSMCPQCAKRYRTSFPEQAIYYYVKKEYRDAELHYTDIFNNKMELDIYIPSLRIGIEYDGKSWHASEAAKKREHNKYIICQNNAIRLIRIREIADLHNNDCDVVILSEYNRYKLESMDKVLDKLGEYIDIPYHNCCSDEQRIKTGYLTVLRDSGLNQRDHSFVKEWDYEKNGRLTPAMFTKSSGQVIWWRCKNGHSWKAPIYARNQGHGCPYCSNQKVWEGFNDLETKNKKVATEWNYDKNAILTPRNIIFSSNKKVWWHCSKCGYEWQASVYNRTIKGMGCPVCSNNVVKIGLNDLATTHPELLKEWNYKKNVDCSPQMYVAGSTKKVWWICAKGHEWETAINVRTRGSGCPLCYKGRASFHS